MAAANLNVPGWLAAQGPSRPPSRAPALEPATPAFRLATGCDAELAAAAPLGRNVACAAVPADEAIVVNAIIPQQTPHDSLVKDAWDYIQSVLTPNAFTQSPLDSVSSALHSIPGLPADLTTAFATLTDTVAAAASSATPAEALRKVSDAADAAATALQLWQSNFMNLGVSMPSLPPLPSLPSLPDVQTPSAAASLSSAASSMVDIFSSGPVSAIGAEQLDLSAVTSSLALLNGTFTETETAIIVSATAAIVALATLTATVSDKPFATTASDAELPSEYDRDAIYHYWTQQPVTMLQRSVETTVFAAGFLIGLQIDKATGKEKENEKKRAKMLRETVDRLGPAYIKVAQALSTRVDLLSPAYYEEITLLQDQVQPFPTEEAMAIIEQELGRPPAEVFSSISSAPIAAASLGQVYRGMLRSTGAEVAIKVQRPGVLELVALDLVLGRRGIEIAGALFPDTVRAGDILPVLDEWAYKLYREMDYRREAAVMAQFAGDLQSLSGIVVPEAYAEATTRRVLCTQWIEGEKLSESSAGDVRQLCTTLLNTYLIQLLDTGLLHADPHPGNLLRTTDGRIAILDYGLVTEVPAKFRVFILEYMAHLSLKDWRAVGQDFVNLQFVAPGSMHPNDVPGLMDAVGTVLDILMQGGGAKNLEDLRDRSLVDNVGLDIDDLSEAGFMDGFATVLENLANPDVDGAMTEKDKERAAKIRLLNEQVRFQLPPYFVLILRAFSVIEGIALKVDPEYSIITETFPYLSRRLLTDDNEEVRRALRQVVYGDGSRMDLERFKTLFDSLQKFSTDGLTTDAPLALPPPQQPASQLAAGGLTPAPPAMPAAMAAAGGASSTLDKNMLLALQSVLSTSGKSYVQELLVEELAATVDSLSRSAAVSLLQRALNNSLSAGTLALLNRLGPLRPVIFPMPLPVEVISQLSNVVKLTEDDEVAIRNVEVVWSYMRPQVEQQIGGQQQLQLSLLRSFASSVAELPSETRRDLVAGAGRTSQMVLQQVMQRTMSRFAQDVANARAQIDTMQNVVLGGGTRLDASEGMPAGTVAMRR